MPARPRDADQYCPRCGRPVAAALLRCPRCAAELIPPGLAEMARRASQDLARRVAGSPYFRSVGSLAYTLRGQVRGFLDDPSHPLARTILRYLYLLAAESGSANLRHLLKFASTMWLLPGTPLLVPAVAYLHRKHREALKQAALGDDAIRIRALRGALGRGEATPDELESFMDESFARWHAQLSAEV